MTLTQMVKLSISVSLPSGVSAGALSYEPIVSGDEAKLYSDSSGSSEIVAGTVFAVPTPLAPLNLFLYAGIPGIKELTGKLKKGASKIKEGFDNVVEASRKFKQKFIEIHGDANKKIKEILTDAPDKLEAKIQEKVTSLATDTPFKYLRDKLVDLKDNDPNVAVRNAAQSYLDNLGGVQSSFENTVESHLFDVTKAVVVGIVPEDSNTPAWHFVADLEASEGTVDPDGWNIGVGVLSEVVWKANIDSGITNGINNIGDFEDKVNDVMKNPAMLIGDVKVQGKYTPNGGDPVGVEIGIFDFDDGMDWQEHRYGFRVFGTRLGENIGSSGE